MTHAPPGYVEPGFGQRLLARVIGSVIGFLVLVLVDTIVGGSALVAVGLAFAAAYEIGFVATRGRTPGKMAMDLAIVDADTSASPSPRQAILRYLTVAAGGLVAAVFSGLDGIAAVYGLIVLVPILGPPLHRGLHDRASGTIVTVSAR